jgi:hypothetical protein
MTGRHTQTPPAKALPKLPAGASGVLPTVWATFVITVLLALAFSFGNVWDLSTTLGVERHVAPLIGPAVDLTAIGLLVVVPWFVLAGASGDQLKAANRLMRLAGFLTLALNSGPSAIRGWVGGDATAWGRALVEAIVPTLLIAWSHVGPLLIGLFVEVRERHQERVAEALRSDAEAASRRAEERMAEIATAAEEAVREALSTVTDEHSATLAQVRAEMDKEVSELLVSDRETRAELESTLAAKQTLEADLETAREALSSVQAELREVRREGRRKPASGGSKTPVGRAPRRTEDEWVDLAKERLPEWQIETPTGSVIGSALDLSSAGTITKIRQRLEADRLALANGGAS